MASSRVCVKNLPVYVDEQKLKEHFSIRGHVTDVKIMRTSEGKSRKFGFVGFSSEEEAEQAIKHFNKSFMDTSRLVCEPAHPATTDNAPRPWSRYSKGSSAYDKAHPNPDKASATQKTGKKQLKRKAPEEAEDPELQEFLNVMQPRSKTKLWSNDTIAEENARQATVGKINDVAEENARKATVGKLNEDTEGEQNVVQASKDDGISDMEYLKKKVCHNWSDDEDEKDSEKREADEEGYMNVDEKPVDVIEAEVPTTSGETAEKEDQENTGRLFVRNLAYTASEADLTKLFGQYGDIVQVHLVLDRQTNLSKGYGYVMFMLPESANRALKELDKSIFQGRLLHIIPANLAPSEDDKKKKQPLTLKQEKEAERKKNEAGGNTQAWNSLYIRPDTVVETVAKQHGISKREFLDPEANDLAVRLALGETQVIAETKRALAQQGVNVELLEDIVSKRIKNVVRSTYVILVKNIPFSTTEADLASLFGTYGNLGRIIIPPAKTIAVVEFLVAFEARKAFNSLAYRKFKNVPLYLEWAPQEIFTTSRKETVKEDTEVDKSTLIHNQLLGEGNSSKSRSVFVKNLNFSTTEACLKSHFERHVESGSLVKVTIKRKPGKKGGEPLSMGFGFLEFDSAEKARHVCKTLQGTVLEGHALVLQPTREEEAKVEPPKAAGKNSSTKIIVRNLAFEATRKDLKQLAAPLGQIKKLKLPKKFDGSHRGFAFVEFVTRQEAQNAFHGLANTHLYGRHLVLEWAKEEQSLEDLRSKTAAQLSSYQE